MLHARYAASDWSSVTTPLLTPDLYYRPSPHQIQMSNPTSLPVSITGILAIGRHVTGAIKQITRETPSAPANVHFLGAELELLCGVLENIRAISQDSTLHSPAHESDVLVQILDAVRGDFEDLKEVVDNRELGASDGVHWQGWNQDRWFLWEPEVADIRRYIEVYKASLLVILSVTERYVGCRWQRWRHNR